MNEPLDEIYRFNPPPPVVGYYCIGGRMGLCFSMTIKPSRWHRFWMCYFLGWTWIDEEDF